MTEGVTPRTLTSSALGLWIVVNTLNLLDAVLTSVALQTGLAYEANPVVTLIGFEMKLVLVALASAAVAWLKPRALWIPAVALGVVVVYTAVGLAASA